MCIDIFIFLIYIKVVVKVSTWNRDWKFGIQDLTQDRRDCLQLASLSVFPDKYLTANRKLYACDGRAQ